MKGYLELGLWKDDGVIGWLWFLDVNLGDVVHLETSFAEDKGRNKVVIHAWDTKGVSGDKNVSVEGSGALIEYGSIYQGYLEWSEVG